MIGHAQNCAQVSSLANPDTIAASSREVIELECGVLVYPPASESEPWRAVFVENGRRRYRQSTSEPGLAAKLEPVLERLRAGASNMDQPGKALIAHYLNPDRQPPDRPWSRKHADTQARLCRRFAAPVIDAVTCQDIAVSHMQEIVNAAPTAGEGDRTRQMLSAMVNAGIEGGYLLDPRLARVHWQAGARPRRAPRATAAGESALWVDPSDIPGGHDVDLLAKALAGAEHGWRHELMVFIAAYSGLRWGEMVALTADQVDTDGRVITVSQKAIEVAGEKYIEAPKNRKYRRTIYPTRAPGGYPLAERLRERARQAREEQAAGLNPLALMFPSPRYKHLRSSNFNRRVLQPAFLEAGWRDGTEAKDGDGKWTWHSLRHVFCTTALFVWKLDATDVSRMAGHANYRITLDMYVGATAGVLDRARAATD